jgi:1-deoxy-D-xylulose-5-phosphate synthase
VGALSHNLESLIDDQEHLNITRGVSDGRTKRPKKQLSFKEQGLKAINISPQQFFESLNLKYNGPIDGHNLPLLLKELGNLQAEKGPRILHIKTVKGKGYKPAEENQVTWHSPGKFDKLTGNIIKSENTAPKPPKYQEVFGNTLVELAKENPKIVGITPAMPSGSSMNIFMKAYPERAFDVGIAEEHAVTFSAGLATQGLLPFCNIYSTFLQRAYDQLIHDVCLQKLKVVFCIDRAGIVGEDGPTHHGVFDIAFLRTVPNIIIACPRNESELRNIMYSAQYVDLPIAIRYPRGSGELVNWQTPFKRIEIGKSELLRTGESIAILALGNRVSTARKAIEIAGINATIIDAKFAKPIDQEMILTISKTHKTIVTIEDGMLAGGFGSAVLEYLNDIEYKGQIKRLGYPDEFIAHGTPNELFAEYDLDEMGISKTLKAL